MNLSLPGAGGCKKRALTTFHSLLILSKGFLGQSPTARGDVEDTCRNCSRPQKTSNQTIQLVANNLGATSLIILGKGMVGQSPATRCSQDVEDASRDWRCHKQVIQLVGHLLEIQRRNMSYCTGEKYT